MRWLLAGLGIVVTVASARAEVVAVTRSPATLDVPATWSRLDLPELAAAFRGPDGQVLALTRADVPNPDAWRAKTRDGYLAQIEAGAFAAAPGQRRTARRISEVHGVPALDLELARVDGSTVVLRVLAFRTHAVSVAIVVPAGAALGPARAIAASLAPPAKNRPDKP
jgi:hypothetical protein